LRYFMPQSYHESNRFLIAYTAHASRLTLSVVASP
jgi:hypothetical protein